MKGYEVIGHTADIGVKAYGATLKDLFVNAANGMFDILLSANKQPMAGDKRLIVTYAVDKDQLLVKWLQELLFLYDAKRMVPVKFDIVKMTEKRLSAEVMTVPLDAVGFKMKHQIKAVTYHKVAIKKVDGQFTVTVIFDI